ncbi:hypothetical protein OKW33_000690 [Paraburkholderia atlantica]|uniref:hypothetical protein n=1 Tax=Paraburkholderia atlantica TaxID=2654982 RepID=UPI003D1B76F1
MSRDQTAAGRAPLAVPGPMFDAPLREPRSRERFIPQTKTRQKCLDVRDKVICPSALKAKPSCPMSDSRQNLSLQFATATLNFGYIVKTPVAATKCREASRNAPTKRAARAGSAPIFSSHRLPDPFY